MPGRCWNNPLYRRTIQGLILAIVLFLVFFNLTAYPVTWYDEGSHLHVPKALILYGKYADYSSEGFRYYGPTVGVGPTVMLPIAGVFKLFGIGLLQARMVMALYLLGSILAFFGFARLFGGEAIAWMATALLVTSRGIALLEYGRQVLGEVPGLLFNLLAFWIWYKYWERANFWQLASVGSLFGLAMMTKNQYLIALVPMIGAAWLLNLIYYRAVPGRFFVIPGVFAIGVYGLWQIILVLLLGPSTAADNFNSLRVATIGAAFVFSPDLMKRAIGELLSLKVYLSMIGIVLLYGFFLSMPKLKEGLRWGIPFLLIVINLIWYVVASISWIRYAFVALAFSTLFTAKLFYDLAYGFRVDLPGLKNLLKGDEGKNSPLAFQAIFSIWFALMVGLPLAQNVWTILHPPENYPAAMAAYMNNEIPKDALVETWEPEMGFLTDHTYHFPPQILLDIAIGYKWRGGTSPSEYYDFIEQSKPEFVLVGQFANYVRMYPVQLLTNEYDLIYENGGYWLYRRKGN